MSGAQMEFALVFTGRTESLKAAANEAKASIASVSNEAGQSTGAIKTHAAALEKDAAAARKAADANRTLDAEARRTATITSAIAQGTPAYAGLATAIDNVNAKLGQQVAAVDKAAAAHRRLHAANQNSGSSFQTANLAFQAQDIAVQAAMGAQPLMIGLQQGMQMAPVLASMERPVAGLAAAFMSLVSPISLITVGLTAGIAALVQYFTTAEEGTGSTTALLEQQNDVIRRAAAFWGEATPALKGYVDELNRAKGVDDGRQAFEIVARKEFDGLRDELLTVKQEFIEAQRAMTGLGVDPAFLRDFREAFGGLGEALKGGTASVADFNRAQQAMAMAVKSYGVPQVLTFERAFDRISSSIVKAIEKARIARSEWIAAMAGGTDVQDIVSRSTFTEGGKTYQSDQFAPKNPAIPTRRPLIELEGLPGEVKANDATARSYRDVIQGGRERIEQMQLETIVSGHAGVSAQRLRFELDLLHDAQEKGRKITPEQRKEIERLGDAYEAAARQAASARLLADLQFERDQLSRSPSDQRIASQLRGAGLPVDLKSYEAGLLSANEALRKQVSAWEEVRNAGRSAIDDITESSLDGFEGIEDTLANIGKGLAKQLLQLGVANPLKNAIYGDQLPTISDVGGVGGFFSKLFGGGMSTASMSVQAATVSVNGGLAGGVGSLLGAKDNFKANTTLSALLGYGGAANDNGTGAGGALSFIGNYKSGVDARLTDILSKAASSFPGFKVDAISGFRAGDPRFHGKGLATDVQLTDLLSGRQLGNYQDARSFGAYERFAQTARAIQMRDYPELANQFRWGGYFGGGKGKYGALDTMHFDLGGGRVGMAGGSWENGLTSAQRSLWSGIESKGTAAVTALNKLAGQSDVAASGLGSLGTGLDKFGNALGNVQAGGAGAGGGGGLGSLFGMLFSPQYRLAASGGIGLYDSGGYTGPGGIHEPRGVVHAGEIVWSQANIARAGGPAVVEAMRLGLRGYASGGGVDIQPAYARRRFANATSAPAPARNAPIINNYGNNAVSYEETTDEHGNRQPIITVGEPLAAAIKQRGNPARQAMQSEFGLRPRRIAR